MEAKEKKEAEEFLFCYLAVPNFSYIYASIRIKISELILNIAFCFCRRNYSCTEDGTHLRTHCVPTFISLCLSKNFTHQLALKLYDREMNQIF